MIFIIYVNSSKNQSLNSGFEAKKNKKTFSFQLYFLFNILFSGNEPVLLHFYNKIYQFQSIIKRIWRVSGISYLKSKHKKTLYDGFFKDTLVEDILWLMVTLCRSWQRIFKNLSNLAIYLSVYQSHLVNINFIICSFSPISQRWNYRWEDRSLRQWTRIRRA